MIAPPIDRARSAPAYRQIVDWAREAIASGDKAAAQEALRAAQPEIARGAGQNLLHRNTASRKISRLASSIKAMEG